MEERTTGLILRTRPLTESSLIVQWLTKDFGRLSTVAKGARRTKSSFSGNLDLFYLADLSFQPSRRSELHTLREVKVRDYHSILRSDVGYLQQAAYFVQLLEVTTEVDTPLENIFELLTDVLGVLVQNRPHPLTVFAFEAKLLAELGLQPELTTTDLSAGTQGILQHLTTADWSAIACLRLTPPQFSEVERFLEAFFVYHFGRFLKGRKGALHPSCPLT